MDCVKSTRFSKLVPIILYLIISSFILVLCAIVTRYLGLIPFFTIFTYSAFILAAFPLAYIGAIVLFWNNSKRCLNCAQNLQYPPNDELLTTKHHAIIVAKSNWWFDNYMIIGVDVLSSYFRNNSIPFKVYICNSVDEIRSIITNPNAHKLWVFGHGWRGGVAFKEKGSLTQILTNKRDQIIFSYSCLQGFPYEESIKKEFIGQFHCNQTEEDHPNVPLSEIMLKSSKNCKSVFLSDGSRSPVENWFEIYDILNRKYLEF